MSASGSIRIRAGRSRLASVVALGVTVGAGLALRTFASGSIAKYGGVALWAAAVYVGVVLISPRSSVFGASVVALAISWAVELAQIGPVPAWLSSQHPVLRLVFGTTYNAPDLPAYLIGVALAAAIDGGRRRSKTAYLVATLALALGLGGTAVLAAHQPAHDDP